MSPVAAALRAPSINLSMSGALEGLSRGKRSRLVGSCAEDGIGEAERHYVHDLLVRKGVGHRLAHLGIVERRLGDVHADILDTVRERQRDDVELAGGLQFLK